jgi:quinohemoprotein ethanol dehydrogenase
MHLNSRVARSALALAGIALLAVGCGEGQQTTKIAVSPQQATGAAARLVDTASGADWPAYGRTYGEQHYSPLDTINAGNVGRLGLGWSIDLDTRNSATAPIAVDGILYFATGHSIIHAVDATTGKELWTYDPQAAEAAGIRLRQGWGSRGIAWWDGRIYTGTQDGRLIAIDAKTGKPVWSVMTLEEGDYRFISGAPRVFGGKIIVGHGGGDAGATRGYVTAYDAATGKQLWRFWTVPGDPAKVFENDAMKMAAATWSGEYWKHGGGGTVWNAISYDPETDTVFIGTGNGAPWNRRIRSEGKGDNLFLCSIVALDGKTGGYKWHYQINPGETWDYNAAMDMHLADVEIGGKPRKVVMQAPKNGFFYVVDRVTGKLISAEKITKVSWASHIDMATGRPAEHPDARFPDGKSFELWPGNMGAHSWQPSSFSARSKLVYIPVRQNGHSVDDRGIDPRTWRFQPGNRGNLGLNIGSKPVADPANNTSYLLAWDPATQKQVWRVPTTGGWNGGVMTTGGGLVFQGQLDGTFNVYDDRTGKRLWTFATGAPIIAPPITYLAKGRHYVTVLTGMGTGAAIDASQTPPIDYRSQPRRVLTFVLDGKQSLAAPEPAVIEPADDPEFRPNKVSADRGAVSFVRCLACHGVQARAAGAAPDLRASPLPTSQDAFDQIVRKGALVSQGMPSFSELSDTEVEDIRQYIRAEADAERKSRTASAQVAPR